MIDKRLIETVEELRDTLKEANAKLNEEIAKSDLYKKTLAFALDEGVRMKHDLWSRDWRLTMLWS